jgi:hypothetical protein
LTSHLESQIAGAPGQISRWRGSHKKLEVAPRFSGSGRDRAAPMLRS